VPLPKKIAAVGTHNCLIFSYFISLTDRQFPALAPGGCRLGAAFVPLSGCNAGRWSGIDKMKLT